jgi:hypothetical protein
LISVARRPLLIEIADASAINGLADHASEVRLETVVLTKFQESALPHRRWILQ